jgi:hypothetical protein
MAPPPSLAATGPEPIALPDLLRPERTPSLPAWVASRAASIKDNHQPDPKTGEHHLVPTLPGNLTLNEVERDVIERHVRELDALCGPTPADDPQAEGAMLIDLTNMMMVLPAAKQNEASVQARGEAYLAALDDLPPWALRTAIRRWYRGDAGTNERGDAYDYHWPPAPAELRKIALSELWRVKGRAADLRRLLRAEPLVEFSDEHCHTMRLRLSALMHETFGIPLVGKDGSSGTVSEG